MRVWGVFLVVLLLTGCLPPSQDQLRSQMDLEEMKRRLAQLEVQQAEGRSSDTSGTETLARQLAESQAGLDNLRVELQAVNGRLDDLGRIRQQEGGELRLIKDDLGLQLNAAKDQLDQLELRVKTLESQAAKKPQVEVPQESPEELYQRALELIRKQKNYAKGRTLLERFGKENPKHDLFVNSLYWTGEALYGEKNYEGAILQFQDVISQHKKHAKAPAALLKQALAFKALGDQQNANTTLQKLIETYPKAEQVAAAKKYLAK